MACRGAAKKSCVNFLVFLCGVNNCGMYGNYTCSVLLALTLHRSITPFIGGTLLKMISCCLLGQSALFRGQHVPTEVSLRIDTATDWT